MFVLALAARLGQLLTGAQIVGLNGYDQSVYYAAADALLHGQVPYRDFVFLHPPVVVLVGLPFALLGSLTTAYVGFVAESVAFAALGALTAALVTAVARRAGSTRWGAVAAGVFYATWSVAVNAGSSVRLEPLGDVLFVTALWLIGPGRDPSRRQLVLAGVVLGVLVNVKLWWAVPVALVFLLTVLRLRRRDLALLPAAAAVTALVIDLPFLLLAGRRMVESVITSQLGRTDVQGLPGGGFDRLPTMLRLGRMTGVEGPISRFLVGSTVDEVAAVVRVVTVVVCVLAVLTAVLALRTSLGRLFVPLLVVQVLVLLTAPIYFPYYGDFVGVSLAMVVAGAARPPGWQPRSLPWWGVWPVGAVVSLALLLTTPRAPGVVSPYDREALAAATKDLPCLVADTPKVLIDLDALDRSFARGCRNWVDFHGVAHGGGIDPEAYVRAGRSTPAWRRTVTRYLRSGDAVILSDPNMRVLLGPARVRQLTRGPLVEESRGVVVHRVVPQVPVSVR